MTIIHEKRCWRCNVVKPLSDFSPHSYSLDGYNRRCRTCVRHRNVPDAEYFEYVNSGLSRCSMCRQWKAKSEFPASAELSDGISSNCYACVSEIQRKYRKSHPEVRRTLMREWREKNPERMREHKRKWYERHKDVAFANNFKRKRRVQRNGGSYTPEEWRGLLERYDYRCLACGTTENVGPDHVIPISKGGTSNIDNLQPLCRHCNAVKYNKIIDYRPDSEV